MAWKIVDNLLSGFPDKKKESLAGAEEDDDDDPDGSERRSLPARTPLLLADASPAMAAAAKDKEFLEANEAPVLTSFESRPPAVNNDVRLPKWIPSTAELNPVGLDTVSHNMPLVDGPPVAEAPESPS